MIQIGYLNFIDKIAMLIGQESILGNLFLGFVKKYHFESKFLRHYLERNSIG